MNAVALRLFANEAYLYSVELRRHFSEPLIGLAVVSLLFLGFYYGVVHFAAGGKLGGEHDLDALLVGYISWGVAGAGYNAVAKHISEEAKTGTLEQLYLSPHRFRSIMICRALLHMFSGLWSAAALGAIAMVLTHRLVRLPLAHTAALLLLGALSLLGVGLIIGGATLVNKRMTTFAALFNLFLLAAVSLPAYPWNGFAWLPFAYAAAAVRAIAAGRAAPTGALYAAVAASSLAYLVVGIVVYGAFERWAKARNLLGQY